MKISVITVLNTNNYGSVLQTIATQQYLQDLGLEVEFVDYARRDQLLVNIIVNRVCKGRNTIIGWIKKPFNDILDIISLLMSQSVFRGYIKKNIKLTDKRYSSIDQLKQNPPIADIYCTGSDQMWNTFWNQGVEKSFFLDYAPPGFKRIAFSTSIGNTSFSVLEENSIVPLIKKYDFITLREKSAEELLARYGIEGHAIMDPTLLFDKSFWEKYAVSAKRRNKPYLLVYQLHSAHDNADFDYTVKRLEEEKNLEVVRIAYSKSNRRSGKKVFLPTIEEFLSLLSNADYIVTDSFHGTAFSINLEKPFSVIYPEKFSTRMDNLLKLTNLENRRITYDNINIQDDIDYSEAREILMEKRMEIKNLFVAEKKNWT